MGQATARNKVNQTNRGSRQLRWDDAKETESRGKRLDGTIINFFSSFVVGFFVVVAEGIRK